MINAWLALGGLGMMLAGILPVLWWRYRTLVPWRDFFLGGAIWMAAIGAKLLMDVTVKPLLFNWLSGIYTIFGIAVISGAYVGLRTGFLESGLTYFAALKSRILKYDYQQAVAFGLGFGCLEAFLLGLSSFLSISLLLVFPSMIDIMPPPQRAAVLEQLTLPTLFALAPILERAFVIAIHVFCSVLAIHGAKALRAEYFILSFLIKTEIGRAHV